MSKTSNLVSQSMKRIEQISCGIFLFCWTYLLIESYIKVVATHPIQSKVSIGGSTYTWQNMVISEMQVQSHNVMDGVEYKAIVKFKNKPKHLLVVFEKDLVELTKLLQVGKTIQILYNSETNDMYKYDMSVFDQSTPPPRRPKSMICWSSNYGYSRENQEIERCDVVEVETK